MKKKLLVVLFLFAGPGTFLIMRTETVTPQSLTSFMARDPGLRGGSAGAGGAYEGLSQTQLAFFQEGLDDFEEAETEKHKEIEDSYVA